LGCGQGFDEFCRGNASGPRGALPDQEESVKFLKEQMGRILLAVAVAGTAASIAMNRWDEPAEVSQQELNRPVLVEYKKDASLKLMAEVFFFADPGKENQSFWNDELAWFEHEKTIRPFDGVELELPPASVMRAPQALPEPGPALEGTHKLPRYGDELPPLAVPQPEKKP
jgi:hypothetical protein